MTPRWRFPKLGDLGLALVLALYVAFWFVLIWLLLLVATSCTVVAGPCYVDETAAECKEGGRVFSIARPVRGIESAASAAAFVISNEPEKRARLRVPPQMRN